MRGCRPPSPERTRYFPAALAEVWSDQEFQVVYPSDFVGINARGYSADVAIVNSRAASIMRQMDIDITEHARFRVFVPMWRRDRAHLRCEIEKLQFGQYHLVVTTQRMFMDDYRKHHTLVYFIDRGFSPDVFYPCPEEEKTRWVVFCGNLDAFGRLRRLEMLAERFPGKIAARTGENHTEMSSFLRSGRIGWNQILGVPHGNAVGINYRVWEVLGSGLLLLCNRTSDVEEVLEDGVHCVLWDDDEDLVEKLGYYLEHDEERLAIAAAGYREAVAKHTWSHRAREFRELIDAYR